MALTGSTTEEKIYNFLISKGLSKVGASVLMANLFAESGLKPTNLENIYEKKLGYTDATYTAAVDNGKYTNFVNDCAGYGLAQWTYYTRKRGLLNCAKSRGASIGDLEMQLVYLYQELANDFPGVLSALKTATDIQSACDLVLTKFENPADQSSAVKKTRAKYAQGYYNQFAGGTSSAASAAKETVGASLTVAVNRLSQGCTGAQVKTVQRILYARGIKGADGKTITVDGSFGAQTRAATVTLQKKLGLEQDGVWGAKTWKAALTGLW